MSNEQISINIEEPNEHVYAGFWLRLKALIIDTIITFVFYCPILYLNSMDKDIYLYTAVPIEILFSSYFIYLTKKYGATPGKIIMKIKVIKLNGEAIGWREVFLRYIISLVLSVLNVSMMTVAILKADDTTYKKLPWTDQDSYLISLVPQFSEFNDLTLIIWALTSIAIVLLNKKRRAPHDFIAGTIVVKK